MTKSTNILTQIGLLAALQCIISPFSIVLPISPVPISLATLILYLSVYLIGKRRSLMSCGIYILIGLAGIPVFSGFSGGIGKVLGPTGGYILGYFFLVWISGWFLEKWSRNYLLQVMGLLLGTGVCYLIGSLWLSYSAGMSFRIAVSAGVLPFIPGDIVKILLGVFLGSTIRRRLRKAGVI